jgi:hypothetical protein
MKWANRRRDTKACGERNGYLNTHTRIPEQIREFARFVADL